MGSLLADTIIFHTKKDARRVARLVKAWDDPRVEAQLVVQDPNELRFESGEWVIGVWGGMDEDDDKSFREMTRMIRSLAHAEPRGLLLLWNGARTPELAEQLAVPAVTGTGDPEDDILAVRRAIQKATAPAPQATAAPSGAFTTNWASARVATGGTTTTIAPPARPIEDDELGVPFVKPTAPKRSNGLILAGLGAVILIGGGAAAAPFLMKTFAPQSDGGAITSSLTPSAPALSAPAPVEAPALAAEPPADATAAVDLPKVERLSPPDGEAMPEGKPASVVAAPPPPKPITPPVAAAKPKPVPAKPATVAVSKPAPKPVVKPAPTPIVTALAPAPSAAKPAAPTTGPKTTLAATGAIGPVKADSDAIATDPNATRAAAAAKPKPTPAATAKKPPAAAPAPPPKPAGPQGPDL